MIFDNSKDHGN